MSVSPTDLGGPYATVLDVGAFRGDFARACLDAWPDAHVLSFEPLEPKPADTDTDRWTWFPTAIGNANEMVTINRNEFVPSSSILPMAALHAKAFPYTAKVAEAQVGMVRLDDFRAIVAAPALLKIDVQGFEMQVLRGAVLLLAKVDGVVLEVSWETLYHGAPTPTELATFLQLHGFEWEARVDQLPHPKAPKVLLQSDEFWVRP